MAEKKKSKPASGAKRTGTVRRPSEAQQQRIDALREAQKRKIWSVVLFAAAILLMAILAIPGAELWEAVGNFIFSMFGIASWIIVALLVYSSVLLALDADVHRISGKIIQAAILSAFICSLFFTIQSGNTPVTYGEAIKAAWAAKKGWGGGFLGALVGWPLLQLGKTPALIVEIVAAIAAFAIMSGKGISDVVAAIRARRERVRQLREQRLAEQEPVMVAGHEIPKDAMARTQLGKKRQKLNFDPAKQFDDGEPVEIPVHYGPEPVVFTDPVKNEPSPEQLASLEAAITALNGGAKSETDKHISDTHPIAPVEPAPEQPVKADPAIDDITKKAIAEVEAQNAKTAETVESSNYKPVKDMNYKSPPIDLLTAPQLRETTTLNEEMRQTAARLTDVLRSFGVETRVVDIHRGPSITQYELQLFAGIKISKITPLSNDIALALAAQSVRIEAPIPGKNTVGIEIPNKTVTTVCVREVMESEAFCTAKGSLTVALGKDVTGNVVLTDLSRMPHLLIAGTTGSGKSVCVNTFLVSLIYKSKPEDVRLLLIDPKVVELKVYNGIPHLLIPVVTDAKKAAGALAWAVSEMLDRYNLFASHDVRDLRGYNDLAKVSDDIKPLPQVVIVIDELSDLMMAARSDVEDSICRLAQMARAAGMHLVIATQRPSTDVITGVIKANIPSRIAFSVSSQIDSRVIIDVGGAEKLLGRGDMLFCPTGMQKPLRVQGCFVSDAEVERVITHVKRKNEAIYDPEVEQRIELAVAQRSAEQDRGAGSGQGGGDDSVDDMLTRAIDCVVNEGKASVSLLQRRLSIGYGRAARMIDEMYDRGIIGEMDGGKPRPVLITKLQWSEMKMRSGMD